MQHVSADTQGAHADMSGAAAGYTQQRTTPLLVPSPAPSPSAHTTMHSPPLSRAFPFGTSPSSSALSPSGSGHTHTHSLPLAVATYASPSPLSSGGSPLAVHQARMLGSPPSSGARHSPHSQSTFITPARFQGAHLSSPYASASPAHSPMHSPSRSFSALSSPSASQMASLELQLAELQRALHANLRLCDGEMRRAQDYARQMSEAKAAAKAAQDALGHAEHAATLLRTDKQTREQALQEKQSSIKQLETQVAALRSALAERDQTDARSLPSALATSVSAAQSAEWALQRRTLTLAHESQLAAEQEKSSALQKQLRSLESQLQRQGAEHAATTAAAKQAADRELARLQEEHEHALALAAQQAESLVQQHSQALQLAQQQLAEREAEHHTWREQATLQSLDLARSSNAPDAALASLQTQLQESEARAEQLQHSLTQLQTQHQTSQSALEHEVASLTQQLADSQREATRLQETVHELTEQLHVSKRETSRVQESVRELTVQLEESAPAAFVAATTSPSTTREALLAQQAAEQHQLREAELVQLLEAEQASSDELRKRAKESAQQLQGSFTRATEAEQLQKQQAETLAQQLEQTVAALEKKYGVERDATADSHRKALQQREEQVQELESAVAALKTEVAQKDEQIQELQSRTASAPVVTASEAMPAASSAAHSAQQQELKEQLQQARDDAANAAQRSAPTEDSAPAASAASTTSHSSTTSDADAAADAAILEAMKLQLFNAQQSAFVSAAELAQLEKEHSALAVDFSSLRDVESRLRSDLAVQVARTEELQARLTTEEAELEAAAQRMEQAQLEHTALEDKYAVLASENTRLRRFQRKSLAQAAEAAAADAPPNLTKQLSIQLTATEAALAIAAEKSERERVELDIHLGEMRAVAAEREQELRSLQAQLEQAHAEALQLREELADARADTASHRGSSPLHPVTEEEGGHSAESSPERSHSPHRHQSQLSSEQSAGSTEDVESLRAQIESLQASNESLSSSLASHESALDAAALELVRRDGIEEEHALFRTKVEQALLELETEMAQKDVTISSLQEELDSLRKERASLGADVVQGIAELGDQLHAKEDELNASVGELTALREEMREKEEEVQEKEQQMLALQEEVTRVTMAANERAVAAAQEAAAAAAGASSSSSSSDPATAPGSIAYEDLLTLTDKLERINAMYEVKAQQTALLRKEQDQRIEALEAELRAIKEAGEGGSEARRDSKHGASNTEEDLSLEARAMKQRAMQEDGADDLSDAASPPPPSRPQPQLQQQQPLPQMALGASAAATAAAPLSPGTSSEYDTEEFADVDETETDTTTTRAHPASVGSPPLSFAPADDSAVPDLTPAPAGSAASTESAHAELIALRAEHAALQSSFEALETSHADLEQQLEDMEGLIAQRGAASNSAAAALAQAESRLEAERASAAQQLWEEHARFDASTKQILALEAELNQLHAESTKLLGEHAQAIAQLENDLGESKRDSEESRRRAELAEARVAELDSLLASQSSSHTGEVAALDASLSRLQADCAEYENELASSERSHAAEVEKLEQAHAAEITKLESDLFHMQKRVREGEEAVAMCEEEIASLKSQLVQLEAALDGINAAGADHDEDQSPPPAAVEKKAPAPSVSLPSSAAPSALASPTTPRAGGGPPVFDRALSTPHADSALSPRGGSAAGASVAAAAAADVAKARLASALLEAQVVSLQRQLDDLAHAHRAERLELELEIERLELLLAERPEGLQEQLDQAQVELSITKAELAEKEDQLHLLEHNSTVAAVNDVKQSLASLQDQSAKALAERDQTIQNLLVRLSSSDAALAGSQSSHEEEELVQLSLALKESQDLLAQVSYDLTQAQGREQALQHQVALLSDQCAELDAARGGSSQVDDEDDENEALPQQASQAEVVSIEPFGHGGAALTQEALGLGRNNEEEQESIVAPVGGSRVAALRAKLNLNPMAMLSGRAPPKPAASVADDADASSSSSAAVPSPFHVRSSSGSGPLEHASRPRVAKRRPARPAGGFTPLPTLVESADGEAEQHRQMRLTHAQGGEAEDEIEEELAYE